MATCNSGVFYARLNSYIKSGAIMKKYGNEIAAKARKQAEEAGNAMVSCVDQAISSSGLTGGAIAAIGDASVDSISESARFADSIKFKVGVSIGQQSRPSLDPGKYGSVNDMAALFNNGYSAGGTVRGVWHGMVITSLPFRPPTYFAQHAVDAFNSQYGAAYNATAELTSDRFN